jgi:succinate-acetate transporter protein
MEVITSAINNLYNNVFITTICCVLGITMVAWIYWYLSRDSRTISPYHHVHGPLGLLSLQMTSVLNNQVNILTNQTNILRTQGKIIDILSIISNKLSGD